MIKKMLWVLVIAVTLVGCSANRSRHYVSTAPESKLFAAAKAAVIDAGFAITQQSSADGFIAGQQSVFMGEGSSVILNVQISRESNERHVHVTLTPPFGTIGGFSQILDRFENSLKKKVPGVKVTSLSEA